LASALTLLLGLGISGCGSAPAATVAVESPVDTAYAYFQAIKDDNVQLIVAHLTPDSGERAAWADPIDGPPPRDEVQDVECKLNSETATDAVVGCSFNVREGWSGFSAGPYGWGLEMRRQSPGPWLIYDQGQG
jgi:hypothetical protein